MIKTVSGGFLLGAFIGMMVYFAYAQGEMGVKKNTQVELFYIDQSHGPWFGKCQQINDRQIACATETK